MLMACIKILECICAAAGIDDIHIEYNNRGELKEVYYYKKVAVTEKEPRKETGRPKTVEIRVPQFGLKKNKTPKYKKPKQPIKIQPPKKASSTVRGMKARQSGAVEVCNPHRKLKEKASNHKELVMQPEPSCSPVHDMETEQSETAEDCDPHVEKDPDYEEPEIQSEASCSTVHETETEQSEIEEVYDLHVESKEKTQKYKKPKMKPKVSDSG